MRIAKEEKTPDENEEVWAEEDPQKQKLDPPPFFKKWRSMYILVLGVWLVLVLLFYIFTKIYQ